jgi:hypothetical protein
VRAKTALHAGRPGTVDQVTPDRQVEPVRCGKRTVARELHHVVLGALPLTELDIPGL